MVSDISKACRRNRAILKMTTLPKAKQELDRLLELTDNGEDCTYEKRAAFENELKQIKDDRVSTMDQVYE